MLEGEGVGVKVGVGVGVKVGVDPGVGVGVGVGVKVGRGVDVGLGRTDLGVAVGEVVGGIGVFFLVGVMLLDIRADLECMGFFVGEISVLVGVGVVVGVFVGVIDDK